MEPPFSDAVVFVDTSQQKNEDQQILVNAESIEDTSNLKEQSHDHSISDALLDEFFPVNPNSTDEVHVLPQQKIECSDELIDSQMSNQEILHTKNNLNSTLDVKPVSETINSMITAVTQNSESQNDCVTEKDVENHGPEPKSDEASKLNGYRCPNEAWSDDDDSSSSDSSSDSDTFFQAMRQGPEPKKVVPVKTKGELELEDLPPIEDLVISILPQEMELVGKIYAIVDKLVVVRAGKNNRPLNLDSVLFLSHENPLGRIFDVFGPVEQPFYSVRFNSVEHINDKGVTIDGDVFFAPEKEEITSYVFVDDLQKQKGSDASWKHNNEPPEECLDYSDDEQERAAKRLRMLKNRNQSINKSMANNETTTKRTRIAGDSSDDPIYIPPPRPPPPPRRNAVISTYPRPNPFSTPRPVVSPSPGIHMMSPAPPPYIISRPNPVLLQQRGILQRPLVYTSYQPPMFGQMTMVSPISPAVHAPPPPVFYSPVPSPITGGNFNQQNYFAQRFPRSPSPAPASPDPWLPNRAPYLQSTLPPNAPLTVQIPPNISSPSPPIHPFQQMNGTVQPFIGTHVPPPFINQQQTQHLQQQTLRFSNGTLQPRFY